MRKNWRSNIILVTIVLLTILSSCGKGETAEQAETYTCPMHPTVVSDRPGSCPVCGMDLVRKARAGEEVQITGDLAKLLKSTNETVIASIKTITPSYQSVPVSVEAQGIVTYDTRNIYTVPARVGGRLEKVFVRYEFQPVTKGQKIVEIYSPELITAQRELLYLIENDADNTDLIQSAKTRVALLGASESQINTLVQRKEVQNTFAIYSPYAGYVITQDQAPTTSMSTSSAQSGGGGMDAMEGSTVARPSAAANPVEPAQSNTLLREGNYVTTGQALLKIINPSSLRIELDLPASQAASVKKGTNLELDFGYGKQGQATVDMVQPFFTEGQDFIKLRAYSSGSDELHIGHLVIARINVDSPESLWVPKDAVLDLGLNQVVFVKEHGAFKARRITRGAATKGWVEVKQGLVSSDEIASNAQYMVDSESFVKTN